MRLPLLPLWLLSAGRPGTLMGEWGMVAAQGWPVGFYRLPVAMRIGLVVIRELEAGRKSIPLRLLGDGKVRQQALLDLQALPQDDPMRQALLGTLRTWRVVLPECADDEERRTLMLQVQKMVEDYENRLREEAMAVGEKRGLEAGEKRGLEAGEKRGLEVGRLEEARCAVERVLGARKLAVNEEQASRLGACQDLATLEQWLVQAVSAATTDDALR